MLIPLRNKRGDIVAHTIIDDDDYGLVCDHTWHVSSGYVRTNVPIGSGRYRGVKMHRLISATPPGMDTDHINGDTLDNRRSNLRVCAHAENCRNRQRRNKNNTSGVPGVHRSGGNWTAVIRDSGKPMYLGHFKSIAAAADAIQRARQPQTN